MWKFQVLITLKGHGLQKFIDADYEVPQKFLSTTDESLFAKISNPDYEYWIRQDNLITAWFLGSMSTPIVAELLDCKTSREVWEYLATRFSSKQVARILDLKTKLGLMKKGSLGLQEYFTKVKNLVDALTASGKPISNYNHILHILAGLGPEYDLTVLVITGNDEFPPLQRVYSMLLTQENRLQRRSSTVINTDGSLPSVNLTQSKTPQFSPSVNESNRKNKNQGNSNNQNNQGG